MSRAPPRSPSATRSWRLSPASSACSNARRKPDLRRKRSLPSVVALRGAHRSDSSRVCQRAQRIAVIGPYLGRVVISASSCECGDAPFSSPLCSCSLSPVVLLSGASEALGRGGPGWPRAPLGWSVRAPRLTLSLLHSSDPDWFGADVHGSPCGPCYERFWPRRLRAVRGSRH